MKKTGAEIMWAMLEHEGAEVAFGIPGKRLFPSLQRRPFHKTGHSLFPVEFGWVHTEIVIRYSQRGTSRRSGFNV